MAKGRERYDGHCVYCLSETALPTSLLTIWPDQAYGSSGTSNTYREGIVWTCVICGEEMFWSVKKICPSLCGQFEWVHWEIIGLGSDAPFSKWNKYQKEVLLEGIWFQRKKIGWRWGNAWSPIEGIDHEKLPKHRH